jgi:hypothetical protein
MASRTALARSLFSKRALGSGSEADRVSAMGGRSSDGASIEMEGCRILQRI